MLLVTSEKEMVESNFIYLAHESSFRKLEILLAESTS